MFIGLALGLGLLPGSATTTGPSPLPTLTVTNGIITPFSRGGVNYIEVLWQRSGSFTLTHAVTGNLALAAGGANGGLSTSGWVPAGGGAGQLIEQTGKLFAAGNYSMSIGAGAPRANKTGGAASNGSPSQLVCPNETLDALGGGKGGQSGSVDGENGGNGGGAAAAGSTMGLPGSGATGGFPGGAANASTDVQQRSAGGGGGADGAGGDGTPSLGGPGGPGRLLGWIANPVEVCRGGKGHRTVTPVSSPDETWGSGSGGCYYGADEQYAGAAGNGFGILVVRADQVQVVMA
ncbi:glycine-rich domain-containing protein [Paracoccus sp. TOH]|uniref:glycine-rich domain-containing protein n=1 Tax=Paracoccus sp. TOH TaxID=1263728 RepID=UPI0025B0BDAF|nr:hypothetical protein [Paracoccus sp. TOH]WJS86690.1 hypothetical protein NBE95_19705 [Paracoccus sp. TOH]